MPKDVAEQLPSRRSIVSIIGLVVVIGVVALAIRYFEESTSENIIINTSMQLASTHFTHNANIPAKYTCDGEDISPDLAWTDAPAGTKSYVLIVRDPDAPAKPEWSHWIVINIPATVSGVAEDRVPAGGVEIVNDFGRSSWGGPCPPDGQHRYFFQLYAVDVEQISANSLEEVEAAMTGHILAKAELMGYYKR